MGKEAYAVKVKCKIGRSEFAIPWKRVKNTMDLCYYCPAKKQCKIKGRYKFKIYDRLRENINVHTFKVVII